MSEPNYLAMSDEELRNMAAPSGAVAIPDTEEDDSNIDPDTDTDDNAQAQQQTQAESAAETETESEEVDSEDDDAADPGTGSEAKSDDEKDEEEEGTEAKADTTESKETPAEEKKTPAEESTIDFKAEYERLLAPFKANGRDIQVKSVDEAVTLMQMGANYNKKMAALKPNLKLMKMLENNGLLSEEKIGFLIDLEKKNPAAINKLVKDSGIDPMDLDAEKASGYKQTAYTVDDREIELDTVLDEIQASPAYNRTLDIVSNKWDAASKQVIAGNPSILRVINDHVSAGIYDRIVEVVENERLFGRLSGLSDIEAYRRVGDALHAQGAFNSLDQGSSPVQQKQQQEKVVIQPKPKQVDDSKLKDKKRAASSTKAGVTTANQDFNPLSMSDDEFSKLVNKQFL